MDINQKEDIRFKIEFLKNENLITQDNAISLRHGIVNNRFSASIAIHIFYALYKMIISNKKEIASLKKIIKKLKTDSETEQATDTKEFDNIKNNKKGA